MKEEEREAGRPKAELPRPAVIVSSGEDADDASATAMSLLGVALRFLQALITFCLLMASTEFFFKTRGLPLLLFSLGCCCLSGLLRVFAAAPATESRLAAERGDVVAGATGAGGELLRPDSDERPLETAESLSESSCFQAAAIAAAGW